MGSSKLFQKSKIQNFLRAWWRYSDKIKERIGNKPILEVRNAFLPPGCKTIIGLSKVFFNQTYTEFALQNFFSLSIAGDNFLVSKDPQKHISSFISVPPFIRLPPLDITFPGRYFPASTPLWAIWAVLPWLVHILVHIQLYTTIHSR